MDGSALSAEIAEGSVSVSTGESAATARSVAAVVSVSMGDDALGARSVEAKYLSTWAAADSVQWVWR